MDDSQEFNRFLPDAPNHLAEDEDDNGNNNNQGRMMQFMEAMHDQLRNISQDITTLHSRVNEVESLQAGAPMEVPAESGEAQSANVELQDLLEEATGLANNPNVEVPEGCEKEEQGDDLMLAEFLRQAETTELVDEDIDERAAKIVNSLFRKKMDKDLFKRLSEEVASARPKNCEGLSAVNVNAMLWPTISDANKAHDRKLLSLQKAVVRTGAIITKVFNDLITAKGDTSKLQLPALLQKINNSLTCLGDMNFNINMFRRGLLKPDLKESYRRLCSDTVPYTTELFGDDLAKLAKDAGETAKMSRKLGQHSGNSSYRGKSSASTSYYGQRQQPYPGKTYPRGNFRGNFPRGGNFPRRRGQRPPK